ncbi:CDP-diacylglycerol--glycerol-3-phosphate 3-phosphatidyltransferase [Mycoplasma sp. ES3157-GEN-MYC]|uniref:CDP-diacylglycerol--glycerol-3-phosphate 3-phosphatidyltransferase n=1 Tax=Mycoplasma miroungigenitalium TaxID=754515 RepID=A0A6M4J9Y7_9MOLU|nr:CDP-diacylglycerol--glycerol-3-phosphate 3-phosphatidyltransferase [Mycoplasma miroungigenitalium]MBU4690640.1 CDP-diacylglycerol--glycerol-3-phosphate 3-phosphatidyltransferase [Mycoplasma miroungigenitalium]MBU4691907.1 CDP-diacylglycerol--glycerol-3-phosphate 3-phosphatidyltransferase [Mycoplasma miroungigenitalium]QJR43763.1 CDP-diacylglycerol--glycerol-3-phosphate 3-phosphatidyltransferase [Mycoplasma miroungigenitalium]
MKFKNLNLPNKLTLIRIILFVPLLVLGHIYLTISNVYFYGSIFGNYNNEWFTKYFSRVLLTLMLIIFIGAMITDYFDGYIARKNHLVTSFGKLWDPIADKMMTTASLIFLMVISKGFIPFWIVLLFVIRDLIVDGCRVAMKEHNIDVSASIWGKIKTLVQTFAIILLFIIAIASPDFFSKFRYENTGLWYLYAYIASLPLIIALIFSLLSGYLYIRSVLPHLIRSNKPKPNIDVENFKSKFDDQITAEIIKNTKDNDDK